MDIETEINLIKERNKNVELNKAWEISTFRKISIIVITYITMSIVMFYLNFDNPFLNALIPTLGYTLSTLSLEGLKVIYFKYYK